MKKYFYQLIFLLTVSFLFVACDKYKLKSNLAYVSDNRVSHTFDFYEPPSAANEKFRPALVAIHGGAWMGGDKSWGEQIAKEFCPYGYVVFSVNYRLSTEADGIWPAQIEDLQTFIRFIKENSSQFGIDPQKIASIGVSAGGHLAAMLALRPDPKGRGQINVAAPLDGEHDMTLPGNQCMADFENIMTHVLGHKYPWSQKELLDISNIHRVRSDVSIFIVHGEGDDNVYVKNGDLLYQALTNVGADVEYVRIPGIDPESEGFCHGRCWKNEKALEGLHEFFDRNLKN